MTPQLRFPWFTHDWQVKKLGDIAQVSSGGTPSRTNPRYWNGDIPWVTTSEINFSTIKKAKQLITKEGLDNSAAKRFPAGSILIALYGQGKTRGKTAVLGINASTNQACAAILTNTDALDGTYLFQNLSSRYDELRELSNDGSQKNLSGQLVKSLKIAIPSVKEQEKIAGFLTVVDDRIAVIDKKVELLKQYKKGVMQKLFTQQIRFKDENGQDYPDWQEKKLRDALLLGSKQAVDDTAKFRKITVSLNKGGIRLADITRKMADTRPFYIRRAGEIIIGKQNYFNGSIAVVPEELSGSICSNAIMSFKVNPSYNTKYIFEYISRQDFLKKREALANGTGQKELSEKDFLNFEILTPSKAEQEKIAYFLSSIDDKIKTEEAKLNAVKKFKKSLLQRMFV